MKAQTPGYLAYDTNAGKTYEAFDARAFKGDIALLGKMDGLQMCDAVVLDFGCGNGRMDQTLLSYGPRQIVGVEVSEPMLENAQTALTKLDPEAATKIRYDKFDGSTLPFDAETFDVIIAHFVFHYIPNLDQVLGELARVAKPGARMVATMNDFSFSPGYEKLRDTSLPIVIGGKLKVDVLALSRKETIEKVARAGFSIQSAESFDSSSAHIHESYPDRDRLVFHNCILVARKD